MMVIYIYLSIFRNLAMLTKRRKVDADCRAFNKWENKHFFEQIAQGALLDCCTVLLLVLFY